MVRPYLALLGLVGLERLAELYVSKRHAAWTLARGGIEVGQAHFPWMKLLHAAFLSSAALEVVLLKRPFIPALGVTMLGLFLVAQVLRYWAITTLGPYWNVRVIVVPGARRVTSGPYRYFPHPNYLAVVIELATLPLIHAAWVTALVFSMLNAILLTVRIRCEEEAFLRFSTS